MKISRRQALKRGLSCLLASTIGGKAVSGLVSGSTGKLEESNPYAKIPIKIYTERIRANKDFWNNEKNVNKFFMDNPQWLTSKKYD